MMDMYLSLCNFGKVYYDATYVYMRWTTQGIGNREISILLIIIDPNDKCIRNDGKKSPNPNDIIKLYYGNPPQ